MCVEFEKYKEELEEIKLTQDGKKALVRALTQREPEKKTRRPVRPLRMVLIAAAACLLLMGTALAASPALREMIWGSFTSYAQEIEESGESVAVYDGVEARLMSAMTDGHMLTLYVRIRDLDGKGRLAEWKTLESELGNGHYIRMAADNVAWAVVGDKINAYSEDWPEVVSYDAETETVLIRFRVYNWACDEETGVMLLIDEGVFGTGTGDMKYGWKLSSELEKLPTKVFEMDGVKVGSQLWNQSGQEDGMEQRKGGIEQIKLSAMGITVIPVQSDVESEQCYYVRLEAALTNGSTVTLKPAPGGADNEPQTWAFSDPVEPDQVVGIYLDGIYIPLK